MANSNNRRQKRMGPAPFASFEDLSDETETSPSDIQTTRLPGIHEDVTPVTPARETSITSTTLTPSAPRIDISRASSSSHHEDSRDSTPERELFQGGNGQGCKLGLAFKEEGALELRSSTEELDFQDPTDPQNQQHRTSVTVVSASSAAELPTHQRKDSQGSEYGGLLSISGRTSRLSSIGSQGSRVSGQSRLSVTSEMSRSPSPHKMLLETSFCGSKTGSGQSSGTTSQTGNNKIVETELLERVLLSRKHDPTEAILAEGISIECRRKIQPADSLVQLSPVLQHVNMQQEESKSPEIERSPIPPEKPARKSLTPKVPPSVSSTSSAQSPASDQNLPKNNTLPSESAALSVNTDVIITVDKPSEDMEIIENDIRNTNLKPGEKIIAESGVEYTFIPLKGPLPKTPLNKSVSSNNTRTSSKLSTSAKTNKPSVKTTSAVPSKVKSSTTPSAVSKTGGKQFSNSVSNSEPQYIRIKLKPDHMYPPEDRSDESCTKPVTLDLTHDSHELITNRDYSRDFNRESRDIELVTRDLINGSAATNAYCRSPKSPILNSTPSPSVSRKSSFASLFRGKDFGTSPESPTGPSVNRRKPSRSRSKSSDRDRTSESADKSGKHKSVFTLFKSKKSHSKSKQSLNIDTSPCRQTASSLHSLEFTFDRPPQLPASKKRYEIPLDADTIIIPLHSPGNEPPPLPLYADTPEDQKPPLETTTTNELKKVENIEIKSEELEFHFEKPETKLDTFDLNKDEIEMDINITTIERTIAAHRQSATSNRQSSTSSENVVFSTNLGSDNEIFTTKLPKRNTEKEGIKEKHEKLDKIERSRSRDRVTPLSIGNTRDTIEYSQSQQSFITSVTSSITTVTSITKSSSRTSITSPVQIRNGIISPCTSVNAKISEIVNEKGITSAKISKSTSPVPRKAEKLNLSSGRKSKEFDTDKEPELSAQEQEVDTSEKATVGGDSSESEREFPLIQPEPEKAPELEESETEVERKGLVLQTDSFDDELPYVPTTLPLERSVAIPIVPVKQRSTFEIKTCPIERPRSTTPINPSCLEEYVEDITTADRAVITEKLRICLPREDSIPGTSGSLDTKTKEREKGAKKWTEFVPQPPPVSKHQHIQQDQEPAPPLPPRGFPKDWINFEEIPERRKPPKRIQTIPSRGSLHPPATSTPHVDETNVIYSYVNPEDCKCECHESSGKSGTPTTPKTPGGTKIPRDIASTSAGTPSKDSNTLVGSRPISSSREGENKPSELEHEEDELPLLLDPRSDSSPESQNGAVGHVSRRDHSRATGHNRGSEAPIPPVKKKSKPTNAFPKVATTRSS